MTAAATPLIGSEEPAFAIPFGLEFFGGPPGSLVLIEDPAGIIPIQPRCWWEPIEDEE